MKTKGSHGPSGRDRRHLLFAFGKSSSDLRKTVANLAIRIVTERLYLLTSCNACKLIALDKCPEVRPIGIGELMRRIIGRTFSSCIKDDLRLIGENFEMCLGQKSGIEHAIHALRKTYGDSDYDAILLIDAQNALTVSSPLTTLSNGAQLYIWLS